MLEAEKSNVRTILWFYERLNSKAVSVNQETPCWSRFQELCGESSPPVNVGYLPPMRESPTEMHLCCDKLIARDNERIRVELHFHGNLSLHIP